MDKKLIIAIDGYSSCGKSTFAKVIAKELKYIYIDSKTNYDEVRKIKEKCKSEVIMTLVKIAISRKNLPKHMNNDGK